MSAGDGGAGGRMHDEWSKDAAARRAAAEERRLRERDEAAGSSAERDTTPALGTAGEPGSWLRGEEGADVAQHVGQ